MRSAVLMGALFCTWNYGINKCELRAFNITFVILLYTLDVYCTSSNKKILILFKNCNLCYFLTWFRFKFVEFPFFRYFTPWLWKAYSTSKTWAPAVHSFHWHETGSNWFCKHYNWDFIMLWQFITTSVGGPLLL